MDWGEVSGPLPSKVLRRLITDVGVFCPCDTYQVASTSASKYEKQIDLHCAWIEKQEKLRDFLFLWWPFAHLVSAKTDKDKARQYTKQMQSCMLAGGTCRCTCLFF